MNSDRDALETFWHENILKKHTAKVESPWLYQHQEIILCFFSISISITFPTLSLFPLAFFSFYVSTYSTFVVHLLHYLFLDATVTAMEMSDNSLKNVLRRYWGPWLPQHWAIAVWTAVGPTFTGSSTNTGAEWEERWSKSTMKRDARDDNWCTRGA